MADIVLCSLCGNPKIKVGAFGEECLECERMMNKMREIPVGRVKYDGLHGVAIESYFRPKGWKRGTNGS